jgi:hypothetical protein
MFFLLSRSPTATGSEANSLDGWLLFPSRDYFPLLYITFASININAISSISIYRNVDMNLFGGASAHSVVMLFLLLSIGKLLLVIAVFVRSSNCDSLSEEICVQEYINRHHTFPLHDYLPNTTGWCNLMSKRLEQVAELDDSKGSIRLFIRPSWYRTLQNMDLV